MGSKPPGPSKQQKQAEKLQLELLQKQLAESQKPLEMPSLVLPKPAPPPPPPPVKTGADVEWEAQDARRKAANRMNAGRGTLFAGETGGRQRTGGGQTLLG